MALLQQVKKKKNQNLITEFSTDFTFNLELYCRQ